MFFISLLLTWDYCFLSLAMCSFPGLFCSSFILALAVSVTEVEKMRDKKSKKYV